MNAYDTILYAGGESPAYLAHRLEQQTDPLSSTEPRCLQHQGSIFLPDLFKAEYTTKTHRAPSQAPRALCGERKRASRKTSSIYLVFYLPLMTEDTEGSSRLRFLLPSSDLRRDCATRT